MDKWPIPPKFGFYSDQPDIKIGNQIGIGIIF